MANLFESSNNKKSLDKLLALKETMLAEKSKREEEERRRKEEEYKSTHIFNSYEEAIDWMVARPNVPIIWHCYEICYVGEHEGQNNMFEIFTQHYSYDGVCCWDVIEHKTREELLDEISKHHDWMESKYPGYCEKKSWLDKYGTLEFVHTIN